MKYRFRSMGVQRLFRVAAHPEPGNRVPRRGGLRRRDHGLCRRDHIRDRLRAAHVRGRQREPDRVLRLGAGGGHRGREAAAGAPTPTRRLLASPRRNQVSHQVDQWRRRRRRRGQVVGVVADVGGAADALLPRDRVPGMSLAVPRRDRLLDRRAHRPTAHLQRPVGAGRQWDILASSGRRRLGLHRLGLALHARDPAQLVQAGVRHSRLAHRLLELGWSHRLHAVRRLGIRQRERVRGLCVVADYLYRILGFLGEFCDHFDISILFADTRINQIGSVVQWYESLSKYPINVSKRALERHNSTSSKSESQDML